jgi:hypothetical protein
MGTKELIDDIINHIKIDEDNLFITYKEDICPSPLGEVKEQLCQIPINTKERIIEAYLIDFLCKMYYEGSFDSCSKMSQTNEIDLDWSFCTELQNNNTGTGWWNPSYHVIRANTNGEMMVKKKGITICVSINDCDNSSAIEGDLVSIKTPSSNIIPEYYMAYGNSVCSFDINATLIFFNLDCRGAITLTRELTSGLNKSMIPFVLHVLHSPAKYRRYNSCFLRINKIDFFNVRNLVQEICEKFTLNLVDKIPAFTKKIYCGISIAEAPLGQLFFPEGFGYTRCEIVAKALYYCHKSGQNSTKSKLNCIHQFFKDNKVDINYPYLNPESEDIYNIISPE